MANITVKPVTTKKDMKEFVELNYRLYKNHPYAVPDLAMDIEELFDKKKNPGSEFSDWQPFIAIKDGRTVGRVVAIVNNVANEKWNLKNVRFGWIDFEEDIEIPKAMLEAVEQWGRERGMTHIQGPMGVTDMDKEGMLTFGFDRIGTMNTLYNYPYYPEFLKQLGYEKDAEWFELRMQVPDEVPEKYRRVAELTMKRYNMHIRKLKNRKDLMDGNYGQRIFDLINEAYAPLFGYSKISQKQIDNYVNFYLRVIDLRMVTLVEADETNELLAVGISMPSIVRALQKTGGKLFPFGWYHLLKSLKFKYEDGVELLLIAVKPEYQSRGLTALLFDDLIPIYQSLNFKWAETNCILEDNVKNLTQWKYLNPEIAKKRVCFKKAL